MKYTFKKPYAIGLLTLSSSFLNANGNMPNSMDSEEFNWATPQWMSLKKPTFGNIDINVANLNMPQQEEATAEPTIIAARKSARGRAIVYEFNNGKTMTRENGTRAWRNNNPGNLVYGSFARENGAVGTDGKFAIFPTEEAGMQALRELLRSDKYSNLTLAAAINKYAPPKENDTRGYQRKLSKITGVPLTTKLSALNDVQLHEVAKTIRSIEGWKAGKEVLRDGLVASTEKAQKPVAQSAEKISSTGIMLLTKNNER